MGNSETIWAKSPIEKDKSGLTLKKHIEDILKSFDGLIKFVKDEKLIELIKLSILLHDLGKALPYFQIKSLGNKNYYPFDVSSNIPHSIFSLFLIDKLKLKEKIKKIYPDKYEEYTQYVLSAVAFHHWRNNFSDVIRYSNDDIETLLKSEIPRDVVKNLQNDLSSILNGYKDLINFDKIMAEEILNGATIQNYAVPPYNLYWLPKRFDLSKSKLDDWVKISGFLMRCDHFASFCEMENNFNYKIEIDGKNYCDIKEKLVNKFKLKNENEIWQVKVIEEKGLHDKNVILVAPTGCGKTEFSFIWSKGEKTFYTLPLRSAVNQIYNRSQKLFDDNQQKRTGLLHSDADVYLLGEGNESENLKSYSLSRQLSYPFIVSTGDQFFPYALRPPSYEKIYATFSYSRLVIDEVQAYDPKSAAIVVKYLEDINRLGGKFLLITATMPKFIFNELKNRMKKNKESDSAFEEIDYYSLGNYSDIKKHSLKFELIENKTENGKPVFSFDNNKNNLIEKIIEHSKANNGQRILVVVNTVKLAIDTFKKIKSMLVGENIFVDIIHSRLTYNSRKAKEEKLEREFSNPKPENENKSKIIIATQVVEASLDLDADILFTEMCPIDSMVQRMGRVLRRYKNTSPENLNEPNVFVTIFKNGIESAGNRVYSNDLIFFSMKILSNQKIDENKIFDKNKNYASNIIKNLRSDKTVKEFFKAIKQSNEYILSEADKKVKVEELYNPDKFAEHNSYLSDFYSTLDILDSGFMTDKKEEAQRIFREISSLSVIPISFLVNEDMNKECFVTDIKDFFNHQNNRIVYTTFKRRIINKYIINVPFSNWQFNTIKFREDLKLENWIEENINSVSASHKNILKKWTKNIWIIKAKNSLKNDEGIFEFEFPELNNFL